MAGISSSCYYFIKEYLTQEPIIEFPIVQEHRLVRLRSLFYSTIYTSMLKSFIPTLGFALTYWLLGNIIGNRLASLLQVDMDDSLNSLLGIATNVRLILYAWILCSQILSNMHLMQHLFATFLSEDMCFPIERNPMLAEGCMEVTLVDALGVNQVPVVQTLAALYLYNVAVGKQANIRQEIFSLSIPGKFNILN